MKFDYLLSLIEDVLLAPNGQPSNLTPDLYRKVRSNEFKLWFGDWENDPANASKILDKNGEPLVVYHGGYFNPKYDEAFSQSDEGIHFGSKKSAEERQSGKVIDDVITDGDVEFDSDIGKWFWSSNGTDSFSYNEDGFDTEDEAREDMENYALEMADNSIYADDDQYNIEPYFLNIRNPKPTKDILKDWNRLITKYSNAGYDGIIYVNTIEDKGSLSYIAFSPDQVKWINH